MNRYSSDSDPEIEYLAYSELVKIDEGLTVSKKYLKIEKKF